jgi:hypothetical protein
MISLGEDGVDELKQLDDEIQRLTAADPELRKKYQQVRAAHTIAESLGDLLIRAGLSFDELGELAPVPADRIDAALSASNDKPATLETVARIAQVAGFRFELQFIPQALHDDELGSGNDEITQNGVPGGVLIRFPMPFDIKAFPLLINGLRRVIKKSQANMAPEDFRFFRAREPVYIWELLQIAEDAGFKLQLRFAYIGRSAEMADREADAGELQDLNSENYRPDLHSHREENLLRENDISRLTYKRFFKTVRD